MGTGVRNIDTHGKSVFHHTPPGKKTLGIKNGKCLDSVFIGQIMPEYIEGGLAKQN